MENDESNVRPGSWQEGLENFKYFWSNGEFDSIVWFFVIPMLIAPFLLLIYSMYILVSGICRIVKRIWSITTYKELEPMKAERMRSTDLNPVG